MKDETKLASLGCLNALGFIPRLTEIQWMLLSREDTQEICIYKQRMYLKCQCQRNSSSFL